MDIKTTGKIKVVDLNSLLTCILCGGYYIDATTISECLHSFCKTCIIKYLQTNKCCPICEVIVHKTRPLLGIRSDQTLQDIVYKVVPGLFKNEMKRRRDFFSKHDISENADIPVSSEKRGDVIGCDRLIFTPEDIISLSLEYCSPNLTFPILHPFENGDYFENPIADVPQNKVHRRYFQCPGAVTVCHLKKLLRTKYNLKDEQEIDIMYMHDQLRDEYTLTDLAYIYSWRRNGPLRLFYKFRDELLNLDFLEQQAIAQEPIIVPPPNCCDISNTSPGPSAGAVPSSQSQMHRHPSPPPSPQMATEPDAPKLAKPKSAAMQNQFPNYLEPVKSFVQSEMSSDLKNMSEDSTPYMRGRRSVNGFSTKRKSSSLPTGTKLQSLGPYSKEKMTANKPLRNCYRSEINRFGEVSFHSTKNHLSHFRRRDTTDFLPSIPSKQVNKGSVPRLSRKSAL